MDSNLKDRLYRELMGVLMSLEDGDIRGAKLDLESLINRLKFNQL